MDILDLIIKKKFAKEIAEGTKVREYRTCNNHYLKRICNVQKNEDGEYETAGYKHFDEARFHDYNNGFEVICKVKDLYIFTADEEFVRDFADEVTTDVGNDLIIIELGDIVSVRGL